MWKNLFDAVRNKERRLQDACSHESIVLWKQDAAMESMRKSRIEESLEMWRDAGIDIGTAQGIRILDLASGCAIKSLALAKQNSEVEITCVDWAEVLEVAMKLSKRLGVGKQISFRAGDVMSMDYGQSEYDAALLGQITYYWNPDENTSVLKRVYRALKPGGVVVIDSTLPDENRCSSESLILAVVLYLLREEADVYTFQEYKTMLEKAGFSNVTKHGKYVVTAEK